MIFVAVGTHVRPFDRLIREAEVLAQVHDEPVVVQRGVSRLLIPHCHVVGELSPEAFETHLERARVLVLHAGSSTFLQVRALGRQPILVPRRPEFGEHVDHHQVKFANSVRDEAVVVEPSDLIPAVLAFREPARGLKDPEEHSRRFSHRLERLLRALPSGVRQPQET